MIRTRHCATPFQPKCASQALASSTCACASAHSGARARAPARARAVKVCDGTRVVPEGCDATSISIVLGHRAVRDSVRLERLAHDYRCRGSAAAVRAAIRGLLSHPRWGGACLARGAADDVARHPCG